jgi:hypothetical protein
MGKGEVIICLWRRNPKRKGTFGRRSLRWEDIIRMVLKAILWEGVD